MSLQRIFDESHFCGGAIVNTDTVVTAGHCCNGVYADEIHVVAGDHNLVVDEGTEQIVQVDKIVIHPDFDYFMLYNDICILKLASSLELNDVVKGITLPSVDQEEFEGTATVSGWGALKEGGELPDVLYAVDVPIVSDASCKYSYGVMNVLESMMCAGAKGHDACLGDSGGPLTCGGVHCGIFSWGHGCGKAGYPGVFTQTSYFLDFIENHS